MKTIYLGSLVDPQVKHDTIERRWYTAPLLSEHAAVEIDPERRLDKIVVTVE